jgi:hypothetical protein
MPPRSIYDRAAVPAAGRGQIRAIEVCWPVGPLNPLAAESRLLSYEIVTRPFSLAAGASPVLVPASAVSRGGANRSQLGGRPRRTAAVAGTVRLAAAGPRQRRRLCAQIRASCADRTAWLPRGEPCGTVDCDDVHSDVHPGATESVTGPTTTGGR